MKTTAFEFRFRFLIIVLIFVIGFVAPWDFFLHWDSIRSWQWLAAQLSRVGWMGFSKATDAILIAGIVVAAVGALLRTWGAAYLGNAVVKGGSLQGDAVVAAGPYRWIRNPLYLGGFLNALALSLLMLPSGAAFTMVALALFGWRLSGAEKEFLTGRLGEAYTAYRARVPSLVPWRGAAAPASAVRPQWLEAFVGEIYSWGTVVSFAALGWRYNSLLVMQGVLVSLGVSIVVRAFLAKDESA